MRIFFYILIAFLVPHLNFAQAKNRDSLNINRYTISLLTCGVGNELYATFGHSALRVIDNVEQTDFTYNYGMFNFEEPNFYLKYVQGKLMYYGDKQNTNYFLSQYIQDQRSVIEQVLNLDSIGTRNIINALNENLKEENKYYKYDFLFNNCSTKIRDLLKQALGNNFVYNTTMPKDSITFMQLLDTYLKNVHWERVGIDLILSSKVNNKMTNAESMFLPNWLMYNLDKATYNGKVAIINKTTLLQDGQNIPPQTNTARWLFLALSILVAGIGLLKNKKLAHSIDTIVFSSVGILGIFFLFMWFGTDHVETNHNLNMLWALPTHIAFGFLSAKNKLKKYAFITCIITILSIPVLLFVQSTAVEIYPLILALAIRLWHNCSKKVITVL